MAVAVPISGTMHYPATPRWITQRPADARFAGFFVAAEFGLSRRKPLESAIVYGGIYGGGCRGEFSETGRPLGCRCVCWQGSAVAAVRHEGRGTGLGAADGGRVVWRSAAYGDVC